MKTFLRFAFLALVPLLSVSWSSAAEARPNILWFVVDDMSANLSCYGEKLIATPNVDRLAREGTRFSRAFTTAPVCSPCRSGFITGMYQTTISAHQHRSGRGTEKIVLPSGVVPVPAIFQQAGYFTCIGSGLVDAGAAGKAKGKNAKKAGAGGGLRMAGLTQTARRPAARRLTSRRPTAATVAAAAATATVALLRARPSPRPLTTQPSTTTTRPQRERR
jgi:hypothetical protein